MVISTGASTGRLGEYIGFQGLGWRNPPILRSPSATKKIDGRVFLLFRDGARTRLVAWRSDNYVDWLAIAHAARPLG